MARVPRVSFLMAVHNGAATVAAAVESMLRQTLAEIEVVTVDDGSTDGTAEILRGISDSRLRVITHEKNRGLSHALNTGWGAARGRYVARMDADDLCMPRRAEKQVAFLDAHSAAAVVGSYVEPFADAEIGSGSLVKYPTGPAVAATILFRNALAHPAVMLRKEAIDRHGLKFQETYRAAQDYGLWAKCIEHGLGLDNIPEALLRYRVHAGQLSQQFSEGMQDEGRLIRNGLLRFFDPRINDAEMALHHQLSRDQLVPESAWVRDAAIWLEKIAALNQRRAGGTLFDQAALLRVLTGRYVTLLRFARKHGLDHATPTASPFAAYIHADALTGSD